MPVIPDPVDPRLKPENASVFDSYWTQLLRLYAQATGANDPVGTVMSPAAALEVPGGQSGLQSLAKLGRGFYSRVEQAVSKLPAKGAHPNKVASLLKSSASAEELAYRNVPEFLAQQGNKTVTPAALEAHLAAHPAPFPTVKTLGKWQDLVGKDLKEWFGARPLPSLPEEWTAVSQRLERTAQQWQRNGDQVQARRFFDLSEHATEIAEGLDLGRGLGAGAPKYAKYQVPGGENYRETLVTLPDTTAARLDARRREIEAIGAAATPAQKQEWADIMNQLKPETRDVEGLSRYRGRPEFTGGHFDEPNVLVHTRANERTLPTGERGRFIEEVQSDWHQKGKKEGYAPGPTTREHLEGRYLDVDRQLTALGEGDTPAHRALREERARINDEWNLMTDRKQYGVPNAPFKETWPNLGLSQQVLEAAEDPSAQWIGFTGGPTQAARYDLSKQVQSIDYRRVHGGLFELGAVDIHGDHVDLPQKFFKAEDLPDVVGKEIADKIIAGEGQAGGHRMTLRGLDLQVGGEGMHHFYDQLLPKRLEKILKPFGGTVEQGSLGGRTKAEVDVAMDALHNAPAWTENMRDALERLQAERNAAPDVSPAMWFARLTPEMKARILKEGLPLMSLAPLSLLGHYGQEEPAK